MIKISRIAGLGLLLALALGLTGPLGSVALAGEGEAACLKCHAGRAAGDWQKALGPHAELSCGECHLGTGSYPHKKPALTPCLKCHSRHARSLTGDLHAQVSCAACHMSKLRLRRKAPGGGVEALVPAALRRGIEHHGLVKAKPPVSCKRCHHAANPVGASAMVPPPKGLLCLPCHVAGWGLPDWPSRIGFGILTLGLLAALGFWLGGTRRTPSHLPALGESGPSLGRRLARGILAFLLDGLLQRRLWRHSPGRGLIHALIFWPFILRFLWALVALILEGWWPDLSLTRVMAAKNHPVQALFFDLTGLVVLAGVAAAALRRLLSPNRLPAGLPGPDWPALGLLAGAVLLGYVLEAARLAMTGWPAGGQWAPAGWLLSLLFTPGASLQEAYGYLWYAHALAWCAFAAYLPFGRMFHIITAPLVLALRGSDPD